MRLAVYRGPEGDVSHINLKPPAKIHIMGICGTAMSALAGLLQERGYSVQGSDKSFYPPVSEELKRLEIPTLRGYKEEHIHPDLDLVIVGNVISKNLPEAQALLRSGLPYITLPEALNFFVIGKKNTVMVCGTHGKTTVSCLCAWVLSACGKSPGFMIGGVAENFNTGARSGRGAWFVVEGDEYDTAFFEKTPKCIHYHATHILLNNIEFDHADIYKNTAQVEDAFRPLLRKKQEGFLIAGVESPLVRKLIAEREGKSRIITYGISRGDWRLTKRKPLLREGGQLIEVTGPDGSTTKIHLSLAGEHNGLNALAVYVLARVLKLDSKKVLPAFKSFKGVRRRFQILGDFGGVTLVEDFAHHPTAVRAVLQSAREMYPDRRILALFEPRSNTSRTNIFQKEYTASLSLADVVFCVSAYDTSRIPPAKRFSSRLLVKNLLSSKKQAFYAENTQDLLKKVLTQARKGDLMVIMSNGDFGGIYNLLKTGLS